MFVILYTENCFQTNPNFLQFFQFSNETLKHDYFLTQLSKSVELIIQLLLFLKKKKKKKKQAFSIFFIWVCIGNSAT